MKLRLCYLLAILWPVAAGYAQVPENSVKQLSIGDTIPAGLEISNVFNYRVSKIKLSDLKGKLVILDFWGTWCNSCTHCFPKLDSLQKKYNKKLQFILVNSITGTRDTKEKIESFFKNWKMRTGRAFELTYAIEDTLLRQLFPHVYISHYVWIKYGKKVIAITGADGVSKENIEMFIRGGMPKFSVKDDWKLRNKDTPKH